MTEQELKKVREVVFERLICGESSEALRIQLAAKEIPDADQLIADAEARVARGRGSAEFARLVRKVRKRRLVGKRYREWKILASVALTLSIISMVGSLVSGGQIGGSIGGLLFGGIILATVEWREYRRINFDRDETLDVGFNQQKI